jgi:hypothetical protein
MHTSLLARLADARAFSVAGIFGVRAGCSRTIGLTKAGEPTQLLPPAAFVCAAFIGEANGIEANVAGIEIEREKQRQILPTDLSLRTSHGGIVAQHVSLAVAAASRVHLAHALKQALIPWPTHALLSR